VSAGPVPGDEEMAAIVAAVEAAWPRPVVVVTEEPRPRRAGDGSWKWSGRWWASRKVPADRRRP
jgi:hypothetical protein